jgi:long-chain fatty acid transport protein
MRRGLYKLEENMFKKLSLALFLVLMLTPIMVTSQTNGTNMIGYGTKSTTMGGADVAWICDVTALNINPAGIVFSSSNMLGLHMNLMVPKANHIDVFGNDLDGTVKIFPLPIAGYIYKLNPDLAIGIGAFAHGGMGGEYVGLKTAFGTTDTSKSNIMHMKGIFGVAYKVMPNFSIGATVDFSYAASELLLFPETSVPQVQFAGLESTDMTATSLSFKFGLMYKFGDLLSFGAAYRTKTDFEFKGTAIGNFTNFPGLGKKITFDSTMTNFNWPQQAEFGIAIKPMPNITLAFDVAWMNFKDSLWEGVMDMTAPAGFEFLNATSTFYFHWDDIWVYAAGIDFWFSPNMAIQLGYNYSNNPVPVEFTNPLFTAIVTDHFTAGFTYRTDSGTEYQFGATLTPSAEATYTNMTMPFGPNAKDTVNMFSINFGVNFPM